MSKHTSVDGRTENFSRNLSLESLLKEVNSELWIAESSLIENVDKTMKMPLIIVMGPMRSGTTLFMQWLANTGVVGYPTNLLSRFFQAPILGAKIQLLLTDQRYNFRDELGEFTQQAEYKSENGKTKGVLAPNEFWYFWRRFLADPSRDVWSNEELQQTMDVATMKSELIGMMDVFQKPFLTKGMIFNYNISFLDSILDKVIFVHIKRDPVANVASVLDARKRQLGSESEWYSFKIPEYEQLKDLSSIDQAAGQVYFINRAITNGLAEVSGLRKLVVQYEDFCSNPKVIYEQLIGKLDVINSTKIYSGEKQFSRTRDSEFKDRVAIQNALEAFKGI